MRSLELVRHMSGLVRGGGLRGAEWWLRAAVTSGRAYMRRVGVEAAGRTLRARRAVLASVTPSALYGRLLPEGAVDSALRAEAASFRHGRAALQIQSRCRSRSAGAIRGSPRSR